MPFRPPCTLAGGVPQTPFILRSCRPWDFPLGRTGRADARAGTTKGSYFLFDLLFGHSEVAYRFNHEIARRMQYKLYLGTSWVPRYDHIGIILYDIILYCTLLHCIILYYIVFYNVILYYTIPSSAPAAARPGLAAARPSLRLGGRMPFKVRHALQRGCAERRPPDKFGWSGRQRPPGIEVFENGGCKCKMSEVQQIQTK